MKNPSPWKKNAKVSFFCVHWGTNQWWLTEPQTAKYIRKYILSLVYKVQCWWPFCRITVSKHNDTTTRCQKHWTNALMIFLFFYQASFLSSCLCSPATFFTLWANHIHGLLLVQLTSSMSSRTLTPFFCFLAYKVQNLETTASCNWKVEEKASPFEENDCLFLFMYLISK